MKFFEPFSKRQKRLWGEVPDVYQYETIPHQSDLSLLQNVTLSAKLIFRR